MEISWTNRVQNGVLCRIKEEGNILRVIKEARLAGLSHLAEELTSRTRYCRKERREDSSDRKRRKKT